MKLILAGLLLLAGTAHGQPAVVPPSGRTYNMEGFCAVYTLRFNPSKNEVYLRCPPKDEPIVTIRDCANPKVSRSADTRSVSVNCSKPIKA